MSSYIIPIIFIIILSFSIVLKKNAYKSFVDGAGEAVSLIVKIFPFLVAIMMSVEVFRQTGLSAVVANFISPAFKFVGIPPELSELMLLRPLSGAGSLAILDNIFITYGTDTYIGKCASVIYGSSETVFYVATIYFSQSNIKNLRYAIPVALICTVIGCIIGCAMVR